MMPEQLEQLKPYTDFVINFINDLMAVFMVQGLSIEFQQVVKVFTMGILLILLLALASFLLKFIGGVLQPAVESLGHKPEYLLYVIFACLILFFTTKVTFPAAVMTLFLFVALDRVSKYFLKDDARPDEDSVEVQIEDDEEYEDDEDEDDKDEDDKDEDDKDEDEANESVLLAEVKESPPVPAASERKAPKSAGEGK